MQKTVCVCTFVLSAKLGETAMTKPERKTQSLRRKFLRRATATAAAGAAGAATLGFPAIVKAQGPIVMRWQSTWPQKDIFHEYAGDFASKVNTMTGGDLKIEVLPAGAVVIGVAMKSRRNKFRGFPVLPPKVP